MELQGSIKLIGETKTYGANGFRKREIVVTTEEQYPQDLLVEFIQDKCDLLSQFSPGQKVTIGINLKGREWTSPQGEVKYFNSIQGWRIEAQQSAPAATSESGMPPLPPLDSFPAADQTSEEDFDDLPF
ncbi:MAG: Uncharacterised protein [Flavobacteriaceae bacterium]|jgi:hypothetical protein|nr:DUF3127 domain-containing protein [Flavobacteriaceae bacterium]CAI8220288.1 MAG: Uncharacterised protein [Flavobacteriaceae bacterium]